MAEIPDVIGGETITAFHMNRVAGRTVQIYTDEAARDASILTPVLGDYACLTNQAGQSGLFTVYDGEKWVYLSPPTFDTGPANVELQGFPLPQTVRSQSIFIAGTWELTGSLFIAVDANTDILLDVTIVDTNAVTLGYTSSYHRGSLAIGGRYSMSVTCHGVLPATGTVRLQVTRSDATGVQFANQCRLVGRMVS